MNEALRTARISQDLDLFHDTAEAVAASWEADRELLLTRGYQVQVVRERPAFVEAQVERASERVLLQWIQDSAFRFFPLVTDTTFGLSLHPFDLATNKVLALVGRVEVRDWVDTIESSERLQHLGYLAWAASGKDPGFNPASILEHAARSARYSADEVATLQFEGAPPDAAALGRRWHALLDEARAQVDALPAPEVGTCVLTADGTLYSAGAGSLRSDLERGRVRFHHGRIRGALP